MLGLILTPFGKIPGAYPSSIAYSYGGNGTYLKPDDPQYNTRGEEGLYYDTQLGRSIPTDAELAKTYGYTPVTSAWVTAKEGFFPAPWDPPNGWTGAGAYGPQPSLSGALKGALAAPSTPIVLMAIGALGVAAYLLYPRKRGK